MEKGKEEEEEGRKIVFGCRENRRKPKRKWVWEKEASEKILRGKRESQKSLYWSLPKNLK